MRKIEDLMTGYSSLSPEEKQEINRKLLLMKKGKGLSFGAKKEEKESKYSNQKTVVDGISFSSKKEADFYLWAKARQLAGEIEDLVLQPKYLLQESFEKNGEKFRAIYYYADFSYVESGKTIVVDTKGFQTEAFKIKRKLFEYRYPNLTLQLI